MEDVDKLLLQSKRTEHGSTSSVPHLSPSRNDGCTKKTKKKQKPKRLFEDLLSTANTEVNGEGASLSVEHVEQGFSRFGNLKFRPEKNEGNLST